MNYYFLVDSSDAGRKNQAWAAVGEPQRNKNPGEYDGPLCVPYIEVEGANINIHQTNGGAAQTEGDGGFQHQIDGVWDQTAKLHDFGGLPGCSAIGSDAGVSVTVQPRAETGRQQRTWFYYSATNDSYITVFNTGNGYEDRYIGTYTKANPSDQYYQGGSSACKPGRLRPKPGGDSVNNGQIREMEWVLYDESCEHLDTTDGGDGTVRVWAIRDEARYAAAAQALIDTGAADDGETGTPVISCDVSIVNPLTWLACPIVAAANEAVEQLDNAITQRLNINTCSYFERNITNECPADDHRTAEAMFQVWSTFRLAAIGILVVIALVMVLSQALSFGPFDAYTIKKVMPRLVIAAIGISVSWYVMKFMIDLTNDIAIGLRAAIERPFYQHLDAPRVSGLVASAGTILGGSALLGLGLLGVLSFALTGLLAVLVAFVILTIREMGIIMLVLVSPVAIACYILPNTQKVWKLWWETFSKSLMMFPIVMIFIAVGHSFAAVVYNSEGGQSSTGLLSQIIMVIAYFGPYFALATAFRLAGGALAQISGIANDRSKGLFDRQKKFRAGQRQKKMHDLKEGNRFKGGTETNLRGRLNRGLQASTLAGQVGANPFQARARLRTALSDHDDADIEKFQKESVAFQALSGDDAKLWAARYTSHDDIGAELARRDAGRFAGEANRRAREDAIAQIQRAQRDTGSGTFQRARLRAQAKTGTGYQYTDANGNTQFDAAAALDDINSVYGNDRNGAGRALAEIRGSLQQSGQIAGAAGFGTWAAQLEGRYRGTTSRVTAHNNILDNAIDSASPAQALYGKPSSAAAFAQAHLRRIQDIDAGIAAGTHTQDDLNAAMAAVGGIYDAMGQASPQNASAFASELMQMQLQNAGPLVDAQGNTLKSGTVREYVDSVRASVGNDQYLDRRRELGSNILAQAQQAQAQQLTAAQQVQQGNLGNFGPPGPPGLN